MKQSTFLKTIWAAVAVVMLGVPVHAGEWVVDHYEGVVFQRELDAAKNGNQIYKYEDSHDVITGDWNEVWSHALFRGNNTTYNLGPVSAKVTAKPIYKWIGEGEPTRYFYVRETGTCSVDAYHYDNDIYEGQVPTSVYSEAHPYTGQYMQLRKINNGFKDVKASIQEQMLANTEIYQLAATASNSQVIRIDANGRTEVPGGTRELTAQVAYQEAPLGQVAYSRAGIGVYLGLTYTAQVVRFSLDFSSPTFISEIVAGSPVTDEVGNQAPDPRNRSFEAYAQRKATYWWDNEHASDVFWNGGASYTANTNHSLTQQLGPFNYRWTTTKPPRNVQELLENPDWETSNQMTVGTSTQTKHFNHELENFSPPSYPNNPAGVEKHTSITRVEVTGQAPESKWDGKLTAKAKVDWYKPPFTVYRAEVVTEVYDYTTNKYISLEDVLARPDNPLTVEEDRLVDEFTTDYTAMKTELIGTGVQLTNAALEVEMMVGTWYVPDEVDIVTGGLTLAGKPLRNLYKVGKTLKATVEVVQRINRVRDKLTAAVPAIQKKLGHFNFAIVMKRKKFREARSGHVGPHGQRKPAEMGELKDEEEILCNVPGGACFVKGTLISAKDGQRTIETIQKDDLVWSRDEKTGQTQLKRVVQTFERHSATLILEFSNGETIETTKEHPFYVESEGFRAAGELGIGTSIVTRAGPNLQLVSAKTGHEQTVYNFEVEDFHTYFVGTGEVWVHNQCTDAEAKSLAAKIFRTRKTEAENAGFLTETELADYIRFFTQMNNDVGKQLSGSREAWLDETRNIVVVVDRNSPPGTVIFKDSLTAAQRYFDELT